MTKELLVLTGPTASGKSDVCDILAERLACRVINCDSKQIYAGLPVITDQPAASHNKELYRLYGYISPTVNYSVGLWLEDAKREILQSFNLGLLPIVTGGSGLYVNSLTDGMSTIPKIPPHVRKNAQETLETMGNDAFYDLLIKIDNNAKKIDKGNTHKILRAYEVIKHTGTSIFLWRERFPRIPTFKNCKILVLLPPKETLYNKINKRFLEMVNSDALSEVQYLMSLNLPEHLPIMKAHGVPEMIRYLRGEIDLAHAIEIAQKNTRHYAKRQRTWFKTQMTKNTLFFESRDEIMHYFDTHYPTK
ncbi:MAG: tRNA (adenosine(37)-N6)-dimethylallyltransferase MiaA [Aaplasma endosymbiont of Hyalomma asiaticum]